VEIDKLVRFAFVALSLVVVGAGAAPAFAQTAAPDRAPTCTLFDVRSRPANQFTRDDRLVVRGADFPPGAAVVVTFDQRGESTELAQVRADAGGGISTSATDTAVPRTAEVGPALITASDGVHAGTCLLTIAPAAGRRSTMMYAIWIAVLAVFGAFLILASFRRWRHKRLESAIAELAPDARGPVLGWAGDDRPLLDDRGEEEEWFYSDEDEPPSGAETTTGRVEPQRPLRTSAAVARLLKEAKGWKDE
jgi:hypothetical protein